MKKILALLFLSAAIISCETEPLDPSLNTETTGNGTGTGGGNVTASIVGDWLYTDVSTTTTTSITFMGNTVDSVAEVEFVSSDLILTFNADGTYTAIGELITEAFALGMSVGNQTQSINDSGTYVITNDVIEFSGSSGTGSSPFAQGEAIQTIQTLDATDLIIEINGFTTQDTNGATIDTVIEGAAEFERQ
ncbi:hypothetical protein [Nonlabens sp. Asnod3-A02]|uniref:hypothetical protein n=1 Tax=Nonlabens sp. Asnod3-A02 TaxID=3160579 RepID=UPI00386CDE04